MKMLSHSAGGIRREANMTTRMAKLCVASLFVLGVATTTHAQQNNPALDVDIGQYYYDSHCAICHGLKGTGPDREPYWNLLSKNIPDLSALALRNGGVFPFKRVYQIIDGREDFDRQIRLAHGSREMPIWGREFTAQSLSLSPFYDPEAFARAKIVALTDYVYRLQAK